MAEQVAVVLEHGAAAGGIDDQCLEPVFINVFYPVSDVLPEAFFRQGLFTQVVFDRPAAGRFRQQVNTPALALQQADAG